MTTVEPIRNIEDIKKIKEILSKNQRNYLLFMMGINCGLRISDILNLDIKDVKEKNYIQLKEKKTGKYKKIPINENLKTIIKNFTKNKNINEPLFLSSFNNRMDRFRAYSIIKESCKKIGLEENIGTHSMRKTFGYHHYKKFKDIVLLQKILNHSNPATTLRYIGIEQDNIEKSYLNFNL